MQLILPRSCRPARITSKLVVKYGGNLRTRSLTGQWPNSGPLDKYPSRALLPHFPTISSLLLPPPLPSLSSYPSLPLPIPSYHFPSFIPSSRSLSSTLSFHFTPSPSPYNCQDVRGSAIAPQRVQAERGRQTHLCAIHSPKSANLLNYYYYFLAWNSGRPCTRGRPLDFAHSAHPTAAPLSLTR